MGFFIDSSTLWQETFVGRLSINFVAFLKPLFFEIILQNCVGLYTNVEWRNFHASSKKPKKIIAYENSSLALPIPHVLKLL